MSASLNMSSPFRAALVAVAALVGSGRAAADNPPLTPEAEAVLSAIRQVTAERNRQLESLYVRYQITSVFTGTPADVRRYLDVVFLVDEEKTLAVKGPKRYSREFRAKNTATEIAPKPPAKADQGPGGPMKMINTAPGQIKLDKELTRAFDGQTLRRLHGAENRIHILGPDNYRSDDGDSGYFNYEYLSTAFHGLPEAINPKKTNADRRLPDALETGAVKVRAEREAVDGAGCVVLEIGPSFIVWADPALGYAVRRWDYRDAKTGYVLCRNDLADFKQVTPGLWLPRVASYLFHAPADAPEEVKRGVTAKWTMRVLEMHANDVPDSLFTFATPPGTKVVDHTNSLLSKDKVPVATSYTVPANPNDLDAAIRNARSETDAIMNGGNIKTGWTGRRFALVAVLVLAALTLAAIGYVRHRRNAARAV